MKFIFEKDCSAEAVVIGIVNNILNTIDTLQKISSALKLNIFSKTFRGKVSFSIISQRMTNSSNNSQPFMSFVSPTSSGN